jgi:hypothetical protein
MKLSERFGPKNPHFPLAVTLAVMAAVVKTLTAEPGHSIPLYMLYAFLSFCTAHVLVLAVYSWREDGST